MSGLTKIGDVKMRCPVCGWTGTLDEAEPAINSEGEYGCPVPDCGTVVVSTEVT